ncbi:MAG: DNA replication/repair protein RecF, partial [Chloroflexi bacterium]|nr:DNA replication/repair protein RecF [Chloroflexota bacterium]
FAPEDVQLVAGPPALRRRYLDMTISQVDRRYLRELQRYQRVLLQRNHLLRRVSEGSAQTTELEYWDQELAQSGAAIIVRRRGAVAVLAPQAAAAHQRLTGGAEQLSITYHEAWEQPEAAASERGEEGAVAAALRAALAAALPRELGAGVSLLGPHRHDLLFTLDGRPLATSGSRGQQRTAALALKLAEVQFLELSTVERPLVLLDDVLSELDRTRRRQVLELASSLEQAFLTVSDLEAVPQPFLASATVLQVEAGALKPLAARPQPP